MSTEMVNHQVHIGVDIKPSSAAGPPPPLSAFKTDPSAPITIKSVGLIYNPVSGNKAGKKRAEGIVKPMLEAAGVAVTMMPTERAGHAIELAKQAALGDFDALLALGGDGTLSDVASGFLQQLDASGATPKAVLGFIPGGTGNTVMHDFNGKRQKGDAAVRAAVEMLLKGHTRKIDCCKIECTGSDGATPLVRHSINIVTAGLGVDANAAAEKRRWMGPMRYDFSIITELLKIPCRKPLPCTLEVDGKKMSLDLFVLTIMNNKHSGVGLRLCPYAQMDDGKIDLMYTPAPISSVLTALKLDGLIKKKGRHVNHPLVAYDTAASSVSLKSEGAPVRIMCDGDQCGFTPLKMTVLPASVTVLTPMSAAAC